MGCDRLGLHSMMFRFFLNENISALPKGGWNVVPTLNFQLKTYQIKYRNKICFPVVDDVSGFSVSDFSAQDPNSNPKMSKYLFFEKLNKVLKIRFSESLISKIALDPISI